MSHEMLEDEENPAGTQAEEELEDHNIKPFRALAASASSYAGTALLYLEVVRSTVDIPEEEFYQTLTEHPQAIQDYSMQAAQQADDPYTAATLAGAGAAATTMAALGSYAGKEGVKELYSQIRD